MTYVPSSATGVGVFVTGTCPTDRRTGVTRQCFGPGTRPRQPNLFGTRDDGLRRHIESCPSPFRLSRVVFLYMCHDTFVE